jgi:NADPH:quinone reductase-like Zn-dependent oxidoreductase
MRSYHTNLGAGIDGLSVREHDTPEPGLNEVLVHVRASSLSFRELMVLRGWYPLPVKRWDPAASRCSHCSSPRRSARA